MVWPVWERSWINPQNAPRASGSTPEVGSSRKSTAGSCRMAQPSASDHLQYVALARRAFLARHAVDPCEKIDVLLHREIVVERELLRHVPDGAADLFRLPRHVEPVHRGAPRGRRKQPAQHAD